METLMEQPLNSPKPRELLHRAVESASSSVENVKIEMLARAFVRGAKDDAVVDEMLMLAAPLREVEVPHVRLMAARWRPTTDGHLAGLRVGRRVDRSRHRQRRPRSHPGIAVH
jgi:hypothetical protein